MSIVSVILYFGYKGPGAANYSFFDNVFINPEPVADFSIAVITPFKQKDLLAGVWQITECGPEQILIQFYFGCLRKGELLSSKRCRVGNRSLLVLLSHSFAVTLFAGGI